MNKRWLKVWSAITGIALTIALVLTFLPVQATINIDGILSIGIRSASANPDWLSEYDSRISHNLTGAIGAGENYQKKITVHYGGYGSYEYWSNAVANGYIYNGGVIILNTCGTLYKLTLANVRSAKAFTIAAGSDWTEQSFGSTVPSNTVLALCMVKSTTAGDVYFKATSGDDIQTAYSIGSSAAAFDGAWFALIPVANQKTWTSNLGASGAFDVYVVGYFTEEVSGNGFYFEMFNQDNQVITNGAVTDWTDVDISSLKVTGEDYTIQGAYIALDCQTDQNVYFRAGGSSDDGVLWEPDTNDPGTHLLGFIPVNSSGVFQYKTGGNAINVYVEGLIHTVAESLSDGLQISDYNVETNTMYADSAWHTIGTEISDVKIICAAGLKSPDALNAYKVRAAGASNTQIFVDKDSCTIFSILVALPATGYGEHIGLTRSAERTLAM